MTHIARVRTTSAEQMAGLAAALAKHCRVGDVIALSGDLGAGKTTFARGFIRELTGADTEVPSPTFTLEQTYDTAWGPLWHFDLYRLANPDDARELGLEEALVSGISVIEWPERLGARVPRSSLKVQMSVDGAARNVDIVGDATWAARLAGALAKLESR